MYLDHLIRRLLMFDLSHTGLMAFLGLGLVQLILVLCIVVILVAYYIYRKRQV